MSVSARSGAAVMALSALLTSGCVSSDLSFRVDKRLKITSPHNRATVRLPVTLSWTIRDFQVRTTTDGGGGSFGVFVDRSPVPPGKPLSWLARHDTECASAPRCPDTAYFARLGVYETTDTELTLTTIPEDDPTSTDETSRHSATIVLLDDQGRRIGEIGYHVDFELKRKGS